MIDVQAIKRELNTRADGLAKGAAYGEYDKKKWLIIPYGCPVVVNMVDEVEFEAPKDNCIGPIIDYLKDSKLPEDTNQARKLRLKVARYTLLEGVLFKKSFSGPLLRCVMKESLKQYYGQFILEYVVIILKDGALLIKH